MASAKRGESKIRKAFVREAMPLFDVWVSACELDEVEAEILRLKYFDESDPTEDAILEVLQEKFNFYYCERQFRRKWRKIQNKISKIIP